MSEKEIADKVELRKKDETQNLNIKTTLSQLCYHQRYDGSTVEHAN